MSREPLDCSIVIDRLIEGERPTSDPQLSEHVGSCLTCFRTANDLKALPQLRRQLLQSESQASDPGTAFWAAFPAQISSAWEASRAAAAAEAAAVAAARIEPSWRERLVQACSSAKAWLRLPVPAALGGALCAAAIIVVATRSGDIGNGGDPRGQASVVAPGQRGQASAPVQPGQVTSPATGASSGTGSDGQDPALAGFAATGSLMPGGTMDESLKELDAAGLWALQTGLERTLADDVGTRAVSEAEEPTESNPTALSDDLEELDDAGLTLLSKNLEIL